MNSADIGILLGQSYINLEVLDAAQKVGGVEVPTNVVINVLVGSEDAKAYEAGRSDDGWNIDRLYKYISLVQVHTDRD